MKKLVLALLLSCVALAPAFAQLAPTPQAAPRTPVNRETLAGHSMPPRDVTGQASVLDGDKLRIGDTDLRLFGVVPPQLSASFGPQARAALDALMAGQSVTCHIRDRDHDGRLLATCQTPGGVDPALDMLRHGLAVAARGSIADTELAQSYVAAEQAAQSAKIGLWSVTVAAPPAVAAPVPVSAPVADAPKPEVKAEAPKPEPVAAKTADVQAKTSSSVMVPVKVSTMTLSKDDLEASVADTPGFFARYQILIAGLLMLATTLSVFGALAIHRRIEKREEMKALAAALRGELLAARAVCQTRIKGIVTEEDDRTSTWPRIRSTLFQAYVGKIGWFGAELARQVASIYGQASDYASYYSSISENATAATTPKRQALQTLVNYIDEVLPRLAGIEQTGEKSAPNVYPTSTAPMPTMPPVPSLPVMSSMPELQTAVAKPTVPTRIVPEVVPKPPEKMVEPVAPLPSAPPEQKIEEKLRSVVRHLRERFVEPHHSSVAIEEPMADYTALIEEEIERYSFGDDDDGESLPLGKMSRH